MNVTSEYGHIRAGNNLGQYHSNPFVVGGGGDGSYNNKVEVLESENGNLELKLKQDYPYASK